jgi:phytoene/squalene synthetase
MFPTLVGVSISHHVDDGVSKAVHEAIREHKNLSPSRIKAVIGSMSADLMVKAVSGKKELKLYLDDKLR